MCVCVCVCVCLYQAPLKYVIDVGYALFAGVRTDITRGTRLSDLLAKYQNESDACKSCPSSSDDSQI